MQRTIYNSARYHCSSWCRNVLIPFLMIGMLFSNSLIQAQDLVDVDVNITRVEWGGDMWCADGASTHLPPLPAVCVDLGNGPDPRFRYKIGYDGANFSGFKHLGAENSPQQGGPVLEDESDTDGANVNSSAHNVSLKSVCSANTLTFDLDGWDEDVAIQGFPCPPTGNYVYNANYPTGCNINLDGNDDARSQAVQNIAVPGIGTSAVTTAFGNFVMKWNVVVTAVGAPEVVSGDYDVCSGTSAQFVTNPSTIGDKEYAWTDANGSILHVGNDFTTPIITSFPATYFVAEHQDGCLGATTQLVVTESAGPCGTCVAPEFLYSYNINWSTVDLGWNEISGAIKYQMEGNPKGLSFIKCTKTTTTNGLHATGMFPFLKYEFRVRTDCPGSGWSDWSNKEEFTLNPIQTSTGRDALPEGVANQEDLETVRFDVSGIFVAHRDANARTITVGYFGSEDLSGGQIILTDISGRQIYTGAFEITPANVKQIHTGDVSDGIYFVSLYKDGILLETEKILVY